jgi:quinol monooxygenase YgiN
MFGLIGKIVTVPGQRDALVDILLESTGQMPGCRAYVVARDPADADAIWVTEVWDDAQSHKASLSLPAVQGAIARARPIIKEFAQHVATEPVGGVGLAEPARRG